MRAAHILIGALLSLSAASGQTADSRPTFEAAVIKPNDSASGSSSSHGSKSQVIIVNNSLRRLVERALTIKPFQLEGPAWMDNVHFDISAKFPIDTTDQDHILMLRTLLEDRFGLKYHEDKKEMSGYALVVSKSGFKLKPVDAAGGPGSSTNGNGKDATFKATAMTMPALADYLARQTNTVVVDKTGIAGAYTFEMKWSVLADRADIKPGDADPGPTLFTVLPEVTGLKLQTEKVSTPIFIVDKLERVPSEN